MWPCTAISKHNFKGVAFACLFYLRHILAKKVNKQYLLQLRDHLSKTPQTSKKSFFLSSTLSFVSNINIGSGCTKSWPLTWNMKPLFKKTTKSTVTNALLDSYMNNYTTSSKYFAKLVHIFTKKRLRHNWFPSNFKMIFRAAIPFPKFFETPKNILRRSWIKTFCGAKKAKTKFVPLTSL